MISLYLFYRINLRIKKLQTNVANFVDNDFSSDHTENFIATGLILSDEISELEKHIYRMTLHIQKQWSALKQQDNLRREMVASISHDLRPPLASIQDYLEILTLKHKKLTNEDKLKYLNTTVKQANGLQKLIDGLF